MNKKPLSLKNTLKSSILLAFLFGCGIGFTAYSTVSPQWLLSPTERVSVRACFSPGGHCTDLIVSAIDETKSSILVAAYSFTSPQIAEALVNAHEKGVDVKILVDKSQLKEKHSQIPFLIEKGLTVYIDPAKGLAHNKIMILDERYVLTGSFNFTRAAESRNAENVLLIDDASLALIYKTNWEKRALSLIPLS